MLPDITLRIDNLVRAMETVVIPAVDPENDLAREQSQLIIGHLKLLNAQWDRAYQYESQALEDMQSLAHELLAIAEGGTQTQAARHLLALEKEAVPEQKPNTSAAINRYTVAIGNAVDTLIYACHDDGTPGFKKHLADLMLSIGEKQIMRERVWFQATGLDPDAESLPSITEMFPD